MDKKNLYWKHKKEIFMILIRTFSVYDSVVSYKLHILCYTKNATKSKTKQGTCKNPILFLAYQNIKISNCSLQSTRQGDE